MVKCKPHNSIFLMIHDNIVNQLQVSLILCDWGIKAFSYFLSIVFITSNEAIILVNFNISNQMFTFNDKNQFSRHYKKVNLSRSVAIF